jgi:predicted TIM-barrel fold metal-dependent hydrolase
VSEIVDSDGHICEPPAVWEEYAEAAFRDRVIQVRRDAESGRDQLWVEGRRLSVDPASACIPGALSDPETRVTWDDLLPGSYDPAARLVVLDEEGAQRALLFPSLYLLFGDFQDAAAAAANCRAYNNWIADFCREDPARLYAVGLVPLQDPSAAAQETRRIAELGLWGIALRPERFRGLALQDDACDPLWRAACDAGLLVSIHGSFGSSMPSFATSRYNNLFFTHMICHPFEQMAACLDIVCGGVLERFPELRVGFFESGIGWLPYWLDRMDEHFEVMGHMTPWLHTRPSELFRSRCFISMEPEEAGALSELTGRGLERCVLWGSDYPHFDCKYPGALVAAEAAFGAAGEPVRDAILQSNPARFLGL